MNNYDDSINFQKISPDLFGKTAKGWAKKIALLDHNDKIRRGCERKNTYTQIRMFYDDIEKLYTKSQQFKKQQNSEKNFKEKILPFFSLITSKVAYARGRDLVTVEFEEFTEETITLEKVRFIQDLENCKIFWEAFMGFYKKYRHN